jgi:hypothetical protein
MRPSPRSAIEIICLAAGVAMLRAGLACAQTGRNVSALPTPRQAIQAADKAGPTIKARAAEEDFEPAHELDPENRRHPLAETAWPSGRREEALAALEAAPRFDSESPLVADYVATLADEAPSKAQTLGTESRDASVPLVLAPQDGQRSFHLQTDKRTLISQVLHAYGIRAAVDPSVNAQRIPFDTDDIDFAEASEMLELATETLLVPLDAKSVLAVADTPTTRRQFQHRATRTFYFPGLSSPELTDMRGIANTVLGAEDSVIEPGKGTLTVRATETELDALDQTYARLLAGRSVLQLEVRLYEIDKTKVTNVGVVLPTSTTVFNVPSEINSILENNSSVVNQLLDEYPSLAGNDEAILAALIASGALTGTVFNNPFALFGGGLTETGLDLSGVSVNLLLNSSDARSFDHQVLRVLDQQEATIRSGERYPITTSSFSSLAARSSPSRTIPQIQYADLGLTLQVRPRVGRSDRVSLDLDMRLSSLAGTSLNNIPILTNRQYSGVVSMRLGDTAILMSDLSKQESRGITGVPGLSDLPGFAGTTNRKETKDVMVLTVAITPHLVRSGHQETVAPMVFVPRY